MARQKSTAQSLKDAIKDHESHGGGKYVLKLYVAGATVRSRRAIENVCKICEEYLKGRYELEVVDIYQQKLTDGDKIIAAPTLIKKLPEPLRTFIGDMSNKDRLLIGLNLVPKKESDSDVA